MRSTINSIVLAAGLVLVLGACGEDAVSGTGDTTQINVDFKDGGALSDISQNVGTDLSSSCAEGETRCLSDSTVEECANGQWIFLKMCNSPMVCISGACEIPGTCSPGQNLGCIDETTIKLCNDAGDGVTTEPCPAGQYCLNGECGEQVCIPGAAECLDSQTLQYCNPEGTGYLEPSPCGEGALCVNKQCVSGCMVDYKFGSYVGCEYWTVDLDQFEDPFSNPEPQPHAVVISNPGLGDAHLQFESYSSIPVQLPGAMVPAGSAVSFEMPRHDLDGSGIFNRSIRILSDRPVLAAQFNPLNNEGVASNDGTLLLPVSTLGKDYYVLSWPSGADPGELFGGLAAQLGYITVVAVRSGTTSVVLTLAADVEATLSPIENDVVQEVPAMLKGQTVTFDLERGQVLQLMAKPSALFQPLNDLTGTHIVSGKEVMVFGGHEEAVIEGYPTQQTGCCAEHLEEQMLPVQALGGTVVCGKAGPRGDDPDIWRILATEPLTLNTEPAQKALSGETVSGLSLSTGQWIEIKTEDSFVATATAPILVGQYLVSQGYTTSVTGDPAQIHGIPVEQWRSDYPVLVPDGYSENWFTMMINNGTTVSVDDVPLDASVFTPIPNTNYAIAHVAVTSGTHTLTGDQPFGVTLVGYANAVSYGMVPGLNINSLAE